MYPCEVPGCEHTVAIRSKIRSGDHKGLKACGMCAAKTNTIHKKSKPISKLSNRTREKNKVKSGIRDLYFDYHLSRITHSEESLSPIHHPSWANCCHLLPKSTHPSLQGHLENVVYLTLEEHTQFDSLLFTHQFDKIEKEFPRSWPVICSRLKLLLPLCGEKTKMYFKLEEYLEGKT